jgi:drug/metabolite transporter (DMT)-like permease
MVITLYSIMCFIFGTTFLLIKTGLNLGWSPFLFSSLRFILAGVTLLVFVTKGKISLRQHLEIFIIALFSTTIPFGALYYGEQYINSGEAAILVTTSPIFILFFQKEKRTFRQLAGAMVCMSGVLLLVLKDFTFTTEMQAVVAKGLVIAAEASFAFGTIRSKVLLEKIGSSFHFNGLQMLYGGVGLLLLAFLKGEKLSVPAVYSGYLILLYFVVVASIVANGIFFVLVKKTNAFFPATWTYVSPMIAMLLGAAILKEKFGLGGVLGAFLVIIGVLLANTSIFKRRLQNDQAAVYKGNNKAEGYE